MSKSYNTPDQNLSANYSVNATSLASQANSFIDIQPQTRFSYARRPPEEPVRSHQESYEIVVTRSKIFGTRYLTPIPLTAEAASPLGVT